MKRLTVLDLRKKADNPPSSSETGSTESAKLIMITAYDATMARLVDRAGADMILVGDSLGMVIQGHNDTLPVTMDDIVYHTRAVVRGSGRAHVVADLPFLSYQADPTEGLRNAGRLMAEGRAGSVKLEGGIRSATCIRLCVDAGIPVVGHVGLTPQSVHAMGGFKVQGRTEAAGQRVIEDALAVEAAGAFCIVLEAIPADLATEITARLSIPTIGIGAGPNCSGQVLVCNDILGLDQSFAPRFVKRYANLEAEAIRAFEAFANEVQNGGFPAPEHCFKSRKS